MQHDEVRQRIQAAFPADTEIRIEGADCDFTALVLSADFDGVSAVKRQQRVLAQFADVLASGELHALSVKAFTPSEWKSKQAQALTQLSL